MPLKSRAGFTLAELLVSLMILGIIATFTIPKILSSQQNAKKTAVLKETIATIEGGIYGSIQTGNLAIGSHLCGDPTPVNTTNFRTLMQTFLNYVKIDTSNDTFTLHSGATIKHFSGTMMDFTVDWNGSAAPNLTGDDQLTFYFNDCTDTAILDGSHTLAPNRFGPAPSSEALWIKTFE